MGIISNGHGRGDIQREEIIASLDKKPRFPWLATIIKSVTAAIISYILIGLIAKLF